MTSTKLSNPKPKSARVSSFNPKNIENKPSAILYKIVMMLRIRANETKDLNIFESLMLVFGLLFLSVYLRFIDYFSARIALRNLIQQNKKYFNSVLNIS